MIDRARFLGGTAALAASAVLAAGTAGRAGIGGANRDVPAVVIPSGVPLEWESDVLDGPRFKLSAYRGRIVVLSLFATWCGPCNAEQPDLVAFAGEHADDTQFVGVAVGEEDADVRRYRAKYGIAFPIVVDRGERIVPGFFSDRRVVFPTTIVVRPDGVLGAARVGETTLDWIDAQRRAANAPRVTPGGGDTRADRPPSPGRR